MGSGGLVLEVKEAQRLRLERFGMAVVTYALVTLASFITQQLGLGKMSLWQWAVFVGVGLCGNAVFLWLFLSGRNLRFKDPSLTKEQIVFSAFWGLWAVYHLPQARPVVIMFYVPAFCFGMLRLSKKGYFGVTAIVMSMYGALLVLEYVQRRPSFRLEYELFLFVLFGILFSWLAFFGGFVSDLRRRLRVQSLEIQKINEEIRNEVEQRRKAEVEKDRLLAELMDALNNVKTLRGLIPICAWCKKIRDDKGYWQQLEAYLKEHSEAELSHGICPDCANLLSGTITGKTRDGEA